MQASFPALHRTPRPIRFAAIAIAVVGGALACLTTVTSLRWVGRVFPGYFLIFDRVVASIGLPDWSGAGVHGLYFSQVVAVNGQPVSSNGEVYDTVATLQPGSRVDYRLRRNGEERTVTLAAQRFSLRDWVLVFGAYLACGIVSLLVGVGVWLLRPQVPAARGLLIASAVYALWTLTAMDLYNPGHLSRLHVVGEAFIGAAMWYFALVFPEGKARYLGALGFFVSALLTLWYQVALSHGTAFLPVHHACTLYFGLASVFFGGRLVYEYWRAPSQLTRERIQVIALGAAVGLVAPGLIVLVSAVSWGEVPINLSAVIGFPFPLFLGYAIVKHDLFEIDAAIRRGVYYLLLTGAVTATYVAAALLFNLVLRREGLTDSAAVSVAFTLAVLLLLNPLRTRLQAIVDRLFFGMRYDSAKLLATTGQKLAAALTREAICQLVRETVEAAMPNGATQLLEAVPAPLAPWLAQGRVLAAADPPEQYPDARSYQQVRQALAEIGAELAVPMQRGGALVGMLVTGRKRSGVFFTASDVELLRAVAQEAAMALQNAASYEELLDLNLRLEERVRERTAQLVQAEKLASLGRLVAGVAHEINNPVSFVASTVVPLRERLREAASSAPAAAQARLREAEELVDIMARGAERTAAIVKDLRSFSRLDEETRKPVDIHDGLDVSLRLLEPRWAGRIAIHREYGSLPLVEGDPGQLNQVFMNLLANAGEAIADRGNVWIATRTDGALARIAIRDDGCGMEPDALHRIFDPFFTTKGVGEGTGLGLAISYGIVTAHGGRIEVESAPRLGTTFTVVLPIGAMAAEILPREGVDRRVSGRR